MPSAPRVLILLMHRPTVDWFAALSRELRRRGAHLFFLSTDWSIEMAAAKLGLRAPNVMHTPIPRRAQAPAGVSLDDIVRHCTDNPAYPADRRTLLDQARRLVTAYAVHFDRIMPDLVIGWNGTTTQCRTAMKLAKSRGIPTLYFELGNFPGRLVADPKGVNWEGSMCGKDVPREFDRVRIDRWLAAWQAPRVPGCSTGIPACEKESPARMPVPQPPRPPRALARTLRTSIFDGVVNTLVRRSPLHPSHYYLHDSRLMPKRFARRLLRLVRLSLGGKAVVAERLDLPERFVFVPLQVHDDTQVIVHSPRMRTMEELVAAALAALPEGYDLIVKPHPADEGRRDYDAIEKMLAGTRGRIVYRADTARLIRRSSAVVTLNSTVGLEALAFMKPVVVLGDAVYAGRGITVDVPDPRELPAKLAEAVRFRPDEEEIKRFLDYFIFEYLRPGDLRSPKPGDAALAAEYAISLLPERKRPAVECRGPALAEPPAPRVSVVMPAYNAEAFVAQAVRSVLAQTHANWELIVVDDGSADRTGEIVKGFADPRIRYLRTENRGPAAARNAGLAECRGEFVAFIDADDAWAPRKLELQLAEFARDSGAALVFCASARIDGAGRRMPSRRLSLGRLPVGPHLERILVRNDLLTPSVMVRREALSKAGGFPEDVRGGEDWEVWRRVALFGTFRYVGRALAAVRYSPGTLSGSRETMNRDVSRVVERAFADPEVRRRVSPRKLTRLRRRAEALLLYDSGWRAMRAGDASATRLLAQSMRRALVDLRQPAMFLASLALRMPFVNRAFLLGLVRK